MDLYYDPVVDEHVGHGPFGVIAPTWYLAPQRPDVAEAGWQTIAELLGALGDGPISGLDDVMSGPMLLWFAGEFAHPEDKARIWAAADATCEPTWDRQAGEFTLGFGLEEEYPRGQINARAMAGWVCERGAWARLFDEPNIAKFEQPTVSGVDFPRVALSDAHWDGDALHVAAHPQNSSVRDTRTTVQVTRLPDPSAGWLHQRPDGELIALTARGGSCEVELVVDDQVNRIGRIDT